MIGALAAASVLTASPSSAQQPETSLTGHSVDRTVKDPLKSINATFARAATTYGIPRDVLVAVGYGETRLDHHNGLPSQDNGYGMMHLASNPTQHSLEKAARITGATLTELKRDPAANIRGGAAVLRALADEAGLSPADRRRVDAWYPIVAAYGAPRDDAAARSYADAVYDILSRGARAHTADGETVSIAPQPVAPERGTYASLAPQGVQSTDYPPALWVPASSSNYSVGRSSAITKVVIHVTQGSYAGSISWFQDPAAQVSAHYVIRSSDGQVTQMVRDKDTAWHARSANPYAVGVEHEGYISNPAWFTEAMYRSSAALTRHLTSKYGIPRDRTHIVGHSEVPGNDHTDPGPNWNWSYYMSLVRGDTSTGKSFPTWGVDVGIRQQATTASTRVASLPGPTTVRVTCQVRGQSVTYDGVTNNAWSYLPDYGGYISNLFIDVAEAWLPGVPTC
ncbi:N-acetylmuramoyl-L-alanine amidase [Streptomyces omiyaensis]|uniref:N-acetylmuramoyl-L-alanine amidase n=1 Tax=Streptomyces omiyaensis TaxID=68247 RepID=UPI0036FA88DC